jgi:DNA end-binding protein Ku
VKLFSAIEDRTVHFRELHAKDGAPIEHRRVSSKTGREVPSERIVKGYETSKGRWVLLTDEEIKAIEAPARKAIEIEDFVPADQVDPIYLDRPYHLGVGDDGKEAYAVLHAALKKTGRVGIGRVVLRSREQLVAVRAGKDNLLEMSTMRYADEIVPVKDLDIPKPHRKPKAEEIKMAAQLTKGLHQRFKPEQYEDEYRERVLDYLRKKARGDEVELPEPEEPEETGDDLAAALEASIKAVRG